MIGAMKRQPGCFPIRWSHRHITILAMAVLLFGLMGCRGKISVNPPIHPNWNMDQQERFDPQEPSPFFEDGRSTRMPVAGTVARGALPEAEAFGVPGVGADGRASAHLVEHFTEGTFNGDVVNSLPLNVPLTTELLERGQDRYDIFCTPCHGGGGEGDGIIVGRGLLQPPSYHDERLRSEPLGHLFRVMTYGVSTGTVTLEGGGNMASYASQLPPEDRWAIATYIRSLQVTTLAGTDLGPVEDSMTEEGTGE